MRKAAKPKQPKKKPASSTKGLDKHWHLATDAHEISLTEIEFSVFRIHSSLFRWMEDLGACSQDNSETNCTGIDFAILNTIRMHDRPKSISEIARLFNRDDISNLQYSIRKLSGCGYIEKAESLGSKKNTTYQATKLGIDVTDKYAEYRRELLMPLIQSISKSDEQMNQVSKVLDLLSGMYAQAACVAATHRDN